MKKMISAVLTLAMLAAIPWAGVHAAENESGEFSVMTFNVAGIPVLGDFQGTQREVRGNARMAKIGEVLTNESGCDIIGTQEDFNHHAALAGAMLQAYPYQTQTSGGVPLGDGLSVFSRYPVYNVAHTQWNQSYGVLSSGTDRLARKGILACVVEIGEGLYIDLYVLHADASNDEQSARARADNYRQLADMIRTREQQRAVIVMGDFNSTFDRIGTEDLYANLVEPAGLKDCWAEIYNNGDCSYDGGAGWHPSFYETYDKIMFKSGGGVELSAQSFGYFRAEDGNGKMYSDHDAARACLRYEITGETSVPGTLQTEEPLDRTQRLFDEMAAVVKTLLLIAVSWGELLNVLRDIVF